MHREESSEPLGSGPSIRRHRQWNIISANSIRFAESHVSGMVANWSIFSRTSSTLFESQGLPLSCVGLEDHLKRREHRESISQLCSIPAEKLQEDSAGPKQFALAVDGEDFPGLFHWPCAR